MLRAKFLKMENLKRVQRNTHRDNSVFILFYFSLNRIIIVLTNVIPIDITHLTIGMHSQSSHKKIGISGHHIQFARSLSQFG